MHRHRFLLGVAAILLLASVLSAAALAAAGPDLSWHLIGGGPTVSSGALSLSGGVGQAVAGSTETEKTASCSGFWCAPPGRHVHVPVALK
jgi:hypothetical protein